MSGRLDAGWCGTALVTGASRGIGAAIARALAGTQQVVLVHYGHDAGTAESVVRDIRAAGAEAAAVQADLTTKDGIRQLAEQVRAELTRRTGSDGLDVLVNNAGSGCLATIETLTEDDLDRVLALNLKAPLLLTQALLPSLRDDGRVINVGSMASRVAHPHAIGYAVSKGGLDAFTRTLAAELSSRRITVNMVAPGLIDTDLHAARLRLDPHALDDVAGRNAYGRLGSPADVADIVAFLASPESRWITGQRIEATGGEYL
jgi:3-oxoacyl-[acyl-carrier protein] reductase